MSDEDRNGMLKDKDPMYLGLSKGDHNAADSNWWTGKGRLRKSIINGIIDFTDVQEALDNWNWQKLVGEVRENEGEVKQGMRSAIAFFYEIHDAMGWDFEKTLRHALEEAYTHGVMERDMQNKTVDGVEFKPKLIEPDNITEMRERIEENLENDKPLTKSEIGWAAENAPELFEQWQEREPRESYLRRRKRMEDKWLDDSDENEE